MSMNKRGPNRDPDSGNPNKSADFEREAFVYIIHKDFDGYLAAITGKRHSLRVKISLTKQEADGEVPVSYKRFIKQLLTRLDNEANDFRARRCDHDVYQPLLLTECTSHIALMAKCKSQSGTCMHLFTFENSD